MALLGNSDNQIGILIKSDADTKAIDNASKSVSNLEKSAGGGGKAAALLGTAGKAAAIGMAAAGAASVALGASAVKSAGSYEQSRIAFETMLGSADKARGMMQDIANFAKSTPFELPEVIQGSKQLLAFGFAQEQILPTMKKLGDLASGLGVPVGQLTNVFGQVRVAGRLMGQDLLQFTNAGVPLIEALATTMGKPQSEIKKLVEQGKVGFPEVEAALNSLTGEGSKFGGMMEKQSKSFSGIVSNIKDGFGQILRGAVGITPAGDIVAGGIFDRIKGAAEKAMPIVQKAAENAGPAVMNAFKKVGEVITTVKNALQQLWAVVGPLVMPSLKALADTIVNQLFPALKRFWDFIEPYLLPTLKVLATVIGAVLVANIWIAVNALNVIINVVSWFINIVIEIVQRIIWFGKVVFDVLQSIYNFWSAIFNAIYEVVKAIFQAIYLAVAVAVSAIMAVVNPIKDALTAPFRTAKDWIVGIWQGLVGFFRGIGSSISSALGNVYNSITAPFSRAWDFVSGIPGRIVNAIGNVGELLRNKIGDWDIPGPLGKVRDVIPGFATGVRNFSGGLAVVGERGPEIVNLPRGADVFTNGESRSMMSATGNRTQSVNIGTIVLGDASAVREMFKQLDSDMLLVGSGLTPQMGAM